MRLYACTFIKPVYGYLRMCQHVRVLIHACVFVCTTTACTNEGKREIERMFCEQKSVAWSDKKVEQEKTFAKNNFNEFNATVEPEKPSCAMER